MITVTFLPLGLSPSVFHQLASTEHLLNGGQLVYIKAVKAQLS